MGEAEPSAPAPAPPPPPSVDVQIEAPKELQKLLETHLDLARLVRVASTEVNEPVSEGELRRLENGTPAQARALLATEGYMTPEITTRRESADEATGRPRVRVIVAPGVRTKIGAVSLQVGGPLGEEAAAGDPAAQALVAQWQAGWTLPAGEDFSNSAWSGAKGNALARLRGTGYAAATWQSTAADIDADRARAALTLTVDSGPRFHVGEIVVEGLERQDAKSVRNLAEFGPGAAITDQRVLDYQESVQRSGLFEGVSVTFDADPAHADAATVTVRVREAPLQQATVGVGISANVGPRVSVEHLHRRIAGWRATLRNKIELGAKRTAWEGELSSHALPGQYRNLLGGAIESVESDTDRVASTRIRLGRAYETQRHERLWFGQLEHVRVRPLDTSTQATAATRTDTTAATLNFHGIWRDLDSLLLPTRGRALALETAVGQVFSADASGPVPVASGPFSRLRVRAQWWQPLGRDFYGQLRLEAGQVFARDAVAVPDTQRFRAGGDDSVRGYAWRSLTPQVNGVDVGGRVVGTASLEVARPISEELSNVWWAVFVDAGRASQSWRDFKPAVGAGAGVRVRSPVGPLRVDLAYGEELKRWRLHLSVGVSF